MHAVTPDGWCVRRRTKIVLPGVGHFQATQLLQDLELTEATRESDGARAFRSWDLRGVAVAV